MVNHSSLVNFLHGSRMSTPFHLVRAMSLELTLEMRRTFAPRALTLALLIWAIRVVIYCVAAV